MKTTKALILVLLSSLPLTAFAAEGSGGTRGGADPVTARKAQLATNFVYLKSDLKKFLRELSLESINDSGVKSILSDLLNRGIESDIDQSNYRIGEGCVASDSKNHAASTENNVRNAVICFDLNEMTKQSTTTGELVGLALHEHAHHYGQNDSDAHMRLITTVAKMVDEKAAKAKWGTESLNQSTRAHATVWTTLFQMKQLKTSFAESGRVKLSSLTNSGLLGREGELQFAAALDNVFVNGRGAKRDQKGDYASRIVILLKDGAENDRNVRWFADQMDSLYTFWEEEKK